MGCSYCIYGGKYKSQKKLSGKSMTWDTLKNSMKFLAMNSVESESIQIDFFGGEPLLEFELIKKAVEYFKSIKTSDTTKIDVTISTNGTILNEKIIAFLLKHNIYIQFSIDGDENLHNRNRIFVNSSKGSHNTIMSNLRTIYETNYQYYLKHVRIKSVQTYTPAEQNFWNNQIIKPLVEKNNVAVIQLLPNYDVKKDRAYFNEITKFGEKLLQIRNVKTFNDIRDRLSKHDWLFFESTFFNFFDIQATYHLYMKDKKVKPFTKGCLFGYKDGNVEPNGKISICYASKSWIIGDVNEGKWYFDKISEYYKRLSNWAECERCFIQNFCDLCPEKIEITEGRFSKSRKSFCQFQRKNYRLIFQYSLQLCENNPDLWGEIDRLIDEKTDRVTAQI